MKMTENKNFFEEHISPSRGDSKKKRARKITLLVIIGVVIVAGVGVTVYLTKSQTPTDVDPNVPVNVNTSTTEPTPAAAVAKPESKPEPVDPIADLTWEEEDIKKSLLVMSVSNAREKPSPLAKVVKTYKANEVVNAVSKTTTGYLKLEDGSFISADLVEEQPTDEPSGGGGGGGGAPKPPTKSALEQARAAGILEKFAAPYAANKQLKGQITVPGTGKVYYVAQSNSMTSYLNKNFYGARDSWGNPYLDPRVSITPEGNSNIVVYAHSNDKAGTQFSGFKSYKDVNFYKKNPTIRFDTIYGEGTYKVVAFFKEDTTPGSGYFRYHDQAVAGTSASFIETCRSKSYWNTSVDVVESDEILLLSTCWDTNPKNFNRLVTVARKVRPGEDTSVDTSGSKQLVPVVLNANGK